MPSPPTSSFSPCSPSLSSLAHYLSGSSVKTPSPPLDSSPSSKRRKTTPKRYSNPSLPPYTYSSSLSASPTSLEGGEEEGEEQSHGLEEVEESEDELVIEESRQEVEQGVDLSRRGEQEPGRGHQLGSMGRIGQLQLQHQGVGEGEQHQATFYLEYSHDVILNLSPDFLSIMPNVLPCTLQVGNKCHLFGFQNPGM